MPYQKCLIKEISLENHTVTLKREDVFGNTTNISNVTINFEQEKLKDTLDYAGLLFDIKTVGGILTK